MPELYGPCLAPFKPLDEDSGKRLVDAILQSGLYSKAEDPLEALELDMLAWMQTKLPPALFAHISGIQTMSAVPKPVLVRGATRLPLASDDDTDVQTSDLAVTSDFLDSALSSDAEDAHSGVIDLAIDIFRSRASTIDGLTKRHWLSDLQKLVNQSMHAGPWACLILGWGAHMCEFGTVHERNPASSTLQKYFIAGARPLLGILKNMSSNFEDDSWSSETMSEIFQAAILQQSVGNQAIIQAALHSFHLMLVEHFDIEPLTHSLSVERCA